MIRYSTTVRYTLVLPYVLSAAARYRYGIRQASATPRPVLRYRTSQHKGICVDLYGVFAGFLKKYYFLFM